MPSCPWENGAREGDELAPTPSPGGHSRDHRSPFPRPSRTRPTSQPPAISYHRKHISLCDSLLLMESHIPLNLYFFLGG